MMGSDVGSCSVLDKVVVLVVYWYCGGPDSLNRVGGDDDKGEVSRGSSGRSGLMVAVERVAVAALPLVAAFLVVQYDPDIAVLKGPAIFVYYIIYIIERPLY